MGLEIEKLRIEDGKGFNLSGQDPDFTASLDKANAKAELESLKEELFALQEMLYAQNQHSLLIIFQAMDAAGKDSAIEHVMSGLNPQGCQVFSFKQPSSEDYEHDFLWRHYKALPEKGRIGIHNRSHYENVLVCKVHPQYILKENRADVDDPENLSEEFWNNRYESIRHFEQHLANNGTVIIKFFLNISKQEQKERFLERIDNPAKNWKFSAFDIDERGHWDDYMEAYQQAIAKTSAPHAPWFVIPANKKWFARVAVCKAIVDVLKSLDLKFPTLSAEEKANLENSRKRLEQEV